MPLLKDVFVPLELSDLFIKDITGDEHPGMPGFNRYPADLVRGETTAKPLIIWDLLSQTRKKPAFRRLAILAWGGFGKTTLLRHVTYSYLTKQYKRYNAPKLLPVLLYLQQWQELLASDPPDLPTLIEQHHIPSLPEGRQLKLPPAWAKNHLRNGNMLVMFDGFDEVKEEQLKDRPRARGIDMPLPMAESQQLLQGLALDMMQEVKEARIGAEGLAQLVEKHLRRLDTQDPITSQEFIDKIQDVSELIVKREEEYEFAHLSFQEFLAAKQIKETKQEQLLLDNWQSQWWRGTILLYAALVNPSNLIRFLIALNNEESITLALRCLSETPRKVDPEIEVELTYLQSTVHNQLYQQLKTYLKNGKWRQADQETLKVMLKVADREEQGWLDIYSIENFPCKDLRIIDSLWVKYSNGKFGFSVQKRIYEELGGTREYNNEEVWDNFGDRVGWRKKNDWIKYDYLTFNLKALPAHLPASVFTSLTISKYDSQVQITVRRVRAGETSSTVQRLLICKI